MTGGRILLILLALAAALAYAALFGGGDAGLERGTEESDAAFGHVEEQLEKLGPDYRWITGLHPALRAQLKQSYELMVDSLAQLKDERVDIIADTTLDDRDRLEALRTLVQRSDQLLADALTFGQRVSTRVAFMKASSPLLTHAETLRDKLLTITAEAQSGDEDAQRISHLLGRYAELRDRCQLADTLINKNPIQGQQMASKILSSLRSLLEELEALATKLGLDVPPRPVTEGV